MPAYSYTSLQPICPTPTPIPTPPPRAHPTLAKASKKQESGAALAAQYTKE